MDMRPSTMVDDALPYATARPDVEAEGATNAASYLNPVYNREFPDPFVLKYCGEYWAYCTGLSAERAFGVMRSTDLVHWTPCGGAMTPLEGLWPHYWAPAVRHDHGTFYLYYSAGNEEHMEIRVATASRPEGPFTDCGHRLTREPFAIDADVFEDDDGTRYLSYATDFLEHNRIGTGIVVDQLLDPYTLAGDPHPVALPQFDWQLYDPSRKEKGGIPWYTVEGSFVLKHKQRYYVMFSGGSWKSRTYAVGYAVTESMSDHREWTQVADGKGTLPIVRTVPGEVLGPGHNSVVRGPDNRQLYCVYHRWNGHSDTEANERVLAIDRLDWCGDRLIVMGPTHAPQPAPLSPSLIDGARWSYEGDDWSRSGTLLRRQQGNGRGIARVVAGTRTFLAELSLQASPGAGAGQFAGVDLEDDTGICLSCGLDPQTRSLLVGRLSSEGWKEERDLLPAGFDVGAYHLIRFDVDEGGVQMSLEGMPGTWWLRLARPPNVIALRVQGAAAAFAGFAVTRGWAHSFERSDTTPEVLGWISRQATHSWRIQGGELRGRCEESESTIAKQLPSHSYEAVINSRMETTLEPGGSYGFLPAGGRDEGGPLITVNRDKGGWALHCTGPASVTRLALPEEFQPSSHQQFRFWKRGTQLTVHLEQTVLGTLAVPASPSCIGLQVDRASAAFDLVRVTALPDDPSSGDGQPSSHEAPAP